MFDIFSSQKEYSDYDTVKELILDGAKRGADKVQYKYELDDREVEKTFNDVLSDISALGAYLVSAGLQDKTKIAILSENSYEWCVAFFTAIVGGFVTVPLDCHASAKALAFQLADCGCDAVVCSREQLPVVEEIKGVHGVCVKHCFVTDEFDRFYQEAQSLPAEREAFLNRSVQKDDLAAIVYTSGTTGKTKGVMLSQRNIASSAVSTAKGYAGGHGIGFLPLNHTFSWAVGLWYTFLEGQWGYICQNLRHVFQDIKKYQPVNFAAVPMVVEMIYKRIINDAKRSNKYEKLLTGIEVSKNFMMSGLDRRRELFSDIHEALGGQLKYILCGGAYLKPEIEEFMYNIGIQIITGYGLTECSPCVSASRIYDFKFGSVGLVLDCNEVKIHAPDENGIGEFYVRGENVMLGYYGDEQETKEAFDGEWLKTGDLGYIDDEGFLFFTGRRKNLIILSNGKNVSPEEVEDAIASEIECVKEVLVYGENNKIVAEIFPDYEGFPDCEEFIKEQVAEINKTLSDFKRVSKVKFRAVEFEKTTTLKIIRHQATV